VGKKRRSDHQESHDENFGTDELWLREFESLYPAGSRSCHFPDHKQRFFSSWAHQKPARPEQLVNLL
jgi:hypothetical protein